MRTTTVEDAVAHIPEGATLMIGGFMGVGSPDYLIDELVRQRRRNLQIIANDTALPGVGIGKLVDAKVLRKVVASHIGLNPETQRQMLAGELQVELVPQGTLIVADRFIANAQAAGIPLEVFHRVAAMASGGMDTLPHNSAVITLLSVCGLTHRQSYKDIFAVTLIKSLAVFVVIAVYRLTGIV